MEDAANVGGLGEGKAHLKFEPLPHFIFYVPGGTAEHHGINEVGGTTYYNPSGIPTVAVVDSAGTKQVDKEPLCVRHVKYLLRSTTGERNACGYGDRCRFRHCLLDELSPEGLVGVNWTNFKRSNREEWELVQSAMEESEKA